MARMKFLCDAERCIECNACVTACKNEHEVPWGVNRRRVVTINDGKPGERSISVACMHCSDAPCMAVCPVDCFYQTPTAWSCTPRTCASAAATASTRARSARRSIRRRATSVRAARWTSAPSARAARKRTTRPGVQEVRPQPSGRGQAAALRGDVLDQGAAGR
jgi:ferredoxin